MLKTIEAALQSVAYPTQPEGLYEPIAYTLQVGGKRIRPTLMLLAYSLYRSDVEAVLPAAIGLETYHNHTLLHDDLMDHADMRRGQPTVHCKWDANTAILSGDAMLLLAYRHLLACTCPNAEARLQLFTRTAIEICEGQQYDVNFEQRDDVRLEEYVEMIRLKTSVLLACALKMGALAADAPVADADLLYAFGESIGLAFQVQDDYLDVYGDPAVFGKNIGGDILCGKKTFLLIQALGLASPTQRATLLSLLHDAALAPAEKIRRVTELYNELGVPALAQQAIDAYYQRAASQLAQLSLPEATKQPLWHFAQTMLRREK